jgi:hypothetical protein
MSTPPAAEPDPPADHADEPPDAADDPLAELLETCLRAERAQPGAALRLVQTAPEALRADLLALLALGRALRRDAHTAGQGPILPAVRARLMDQIASQRPT